MYINLDGDELETAIKEYLQARGVEDNASFKIRVIGGRAGNKSTAQIDVTYDRTEPVAPVSKTYAPKKELDHDPYEEEPEVVSEPVEAPENLFQEEVTPEPEEEPSIEEEASEEPAGKVTPMKSLFK